MTEEEKRNEMNVCFVQTFCKVNYLVSKTAIIHFFRSM